MHTPLPTLLAALALAGASTLAAAQAPAARTCQPLDTRPPNAEQTPAFPGQTRACAARTDTAFEVTVLATGLANPWAVEPLPGGDLLVTEKAGRMRVVTAAGQVLAPIAGVPPVDARGQGGLLDVALSPRFASDRTVFWSYSEPRQGGNATSVARAVLSADRTRLENVAVIVRAQPTYDGDKHFGSRLAFGPDGMLYVTLGERSDRGMRPQAQELGSHMGKILRVTADGAAPPDNPYVGRAGALPEIWSLGQRNVQSAVFDPSGRLWVVEHGTRGGDELNRIEKGKNYGWPIAAYGIEYGGGRIGDGRTQATGTEQPLYFWDPVIGPSGAEWYTGDAFPAWKDSLFVGALRDRALVRLVLGPDGRVTGEERLLVERGKRIRDVRQGADGALYVVTDESRGEVWKIAPRR
jgi:glucose/arabinose dehydrogenase